MEKETYNLDDILSEVKKRREEQEKSLRNIETIDSKQTNSSVTQEISEQKSEEIKPKNDSSNKKQEIKNTEKSEDVKTSEDKAEDKKPEKSDNEEQKQKDEELTFKEAAEEKSDTKQEEEEEEADEGMIDILHFAENDVEYIDDNTEQEKPKFFKTKKGKIVKIIIIVLVLLIVGAGIFAAVYLNNMLNNVTQDDNDKDNTYNAVTYYDGMDFLQEDFPLIEEQSAYNVYGYKQYLKDWYNNGDPVRSTHVMNVLLIGEDTREEQISDTSRADSAIIASINIDTGTIHLTSVLRDLYVYYEVNGEGSYGKINESAGNGGINTYIKTLERYYKIAIDGYAVVNFASFPKIIDALGGVDINITTAEINEINNHPYTYGDVGEVYIEKTFEGNEGVMRLDGIQALAYCRIRHIDSDFARADRQKTVLAELLNKVKNGSTIDAVKVVNQFSQYTKTSYSKKELISIGNLALRDGWLNYEIQNTNVPAEENRAGGENFSVSYNNWIWLADIPKDAYELQMKIYGKSNIKLNENRPDYISMGR